MKTKIFSGKKIKIMRSSKRDLRNVKKFKNFINSLIKEEAKIMMGKKRSLKEEIIWLKEKLKKVKNHQAVFLIAEDENKVVGTTGITLGREREAHIGHFGITIRKGYRGIGLGTYLTKEIIKLAKKELRPGPKIIRLSVWAINKPAIDFYKNLGFKKVAKIPKQGKFQGKFVDEVVMLLDLT